MPDWYPMGPNMGDSVKAGVEWLRRELEKIDGPVIFIHDSQYEGDIREWIKEKQREGEARA